MKTYLKSILAIIVILLCACEKDPTFEFQSIDDNATKVFNITATSADVTFSIIIAQSGRYSIVNHNYADDYVEIYYSTSSNPFQGLAEYKYVYSAGTYTLQLKKLEPGTTYYYAAKLGDQKGEVRSFTTKGITVETGTATDITATSVRLHGNCTLLNGAQLAEAGVLLKRNDSNVSWTNYDKYGSGTYANFQADFTNLSSNSTYYYRAYAKDKDGNVYYGDVKSFKTLSQPVRSAKTVVDLGLSVKWAAGNVGATYETDYGNFYAWGETNSKSNYSWSTYKWCNGSYYTMTKYCTQSDLGKVDNKITLDLEDDAAHVKWGGSWRMPTRAEQDELLTKCTWTWTQKNGINGYEVKGPNGNSIFLPASGRREGPSPNSVGTFGYCWSSSLPIEYNLGAAYCLSFDAGFVDWIGVSRAYGLPIRPVCQ